VEMGITVENREFSAELNNKSSPQFQNLSNTFKQEVCEIQNKIITKKTLYSLTEKQ
jgi:hypothetical protein